jgi:VWFA-related protein
MHRRIIVLGFLLLVPPLGMRAIPQDQAPAASPAAVPAPQVIRTTTRLVQVSVVVTDKKGEPITGLRKEDFTVLDEGKPENIAIFTSAAPAPTAALEPLPPNVFTNRYELKGQDPGAVTVILFDAENTATEDQAYVRKQVLHLLGMLKPQDHVAIYALIGKLLILHDFTQDNSALVQAVNRFTPKQMAEFDASNVDKVDLVSLGGDTQWQYLQDALNRSNGMMSDRYTRNRVETTASALETIADHVAGIPGRKSLVWVSGGFPIQLGIPEIGRPDNNAMQGMNGGSTGAKGPQPGVPLPGQGCAPTVNQLNCPYIDDGTFADIIKRVAAALNRVNMAIYPVDARGLTVDPGMSPGGSSGSIAPAGRSATTSQTNAVLTKEEDTRATSRLLADETGGQAFYGTNDIRNALRRAFDDGRYAYTIGFYPGHNTWDGKFRKLTITVNRENARLRYRKGYFAAPDQKESAEAAKMELQEAAMAPIDATALGVTVSGKYIPPASDRKLELHIGIDPTQLLLQDIDNHRKGGVDLFYLQMDASGKVLGAEQQRVGLNLEEKQYEYLTKAGIVFERHLAVQPQTTEIHIVVRDVGTGALGSVAVSTVAFFKAEENPAPAAKTN